MKKPLSSQRAVILASLCFAGLILFSTNAKADAQAGAATYKTKCASCHGAGGKGKAALKTQDLALRGGPEYERRRAHSHHHGR